MANNGSSNHLRATSGLSPASDIQMPMSAFVPISSVLPPASDVAGTPGERLNLTQRRHLINPPGYPRHLLCCVGPRAVICGPGILPAP
jgi:hypothetical protein